MASPLATHESKIPPHLIGTNYELSLDNSLHALFASRQNHKSPTSSSLASNFLELILSKVDPALEATWVSAALSFNAPKNESLNPVSAIKDLFQLIISYSASSSPIKSVVLIAPVLYKLHYFMLDAVESQQGSKKERKANREVKNLLDSVLGYVSICCEGFDGNFDYLEGLMRGFEDLISLWIEDEMMQNNNAETVGVFFPFLSSDAVKRVNVEGCGMADLSGFVIGEAILLKLCWKIKEEGFGESMQNELKSWLVCSITGSQSSYLYVTLLNMLLEPALPLTSVMDSKYEDGVKEVLLGALLLVEYSFLTPEKLGKLPAKHANRLIFTKLLVTHEANEFFRRIGNQAKAIPYLNAFSNSSLPSQILKLVGREVGNDSSASFPLASSPIAVLRWMLNIENRGLKIFDDDLLEHHARLVLENSNQELEQLTSEGNGHLQNSDLFYIDDKGEEESETEDDEMVMRSMSSAFMAAAHEPCSTEQGVRKRKIRKGEKRKGVKFVRLNRVEDACLTDEQAKKDGLNSGSEIENPSSSDDDM